MFNKQKCIESFKMSKEKTFNLYYTHTFFAHCYDEKIYVFYYKLNVGIGFLFKDIYLLTICNKSFIILKNEKLSAKSIRLNKNMVLDFIVFVSFDKMFFIQKQKKLFILMPTSRFNRFYSYRVLVFDVKNDLLYFVEDFLPLFRPSALFHSYKCLNFTLGKNGTVYGIFQYEKLFSTDVGAETEILTEIRAFQIINDKLVDEGVKWRNLEGLSESGFPSVTSACFV